MRTELEKTRSVFGPEFEHRQVRENRVSIISAGAGGVVGGVVAVIVRVLGGGGEILKGRMIIGGIEGMRNSNRLARAPK